MSKIIKFPQGLTICSNKEDGLKITKGTQKIEFDCDEAFFIVKDALMALSMPQLAAICQRASMFMIMFSDLEKNEEDDLDIDLYNQYIEEI